MINTNWNAGYRDCRAGVIPQSNNADYLRGYAWAVGGFR